MANLTDHNWQQTSQISVQMSPIGTFKIISPLLGNPVYSLSKMAVSEPNSRHLWEVLIFHFHSKKTVAEAHRMLLSTYGEAALSERTCREWFQRFKSGDFDVEDRHGTEIMFPTSWSRERLNGVSLLVKSCFKDDNPKRRKSWGMPKHASLSTTRPNIYGAKVMLSIWWEQIGVVYYELLKPSETITGNQYRTQLMRLSRALKKLMRQYQERHEKVILQHDNTRPYVAIPIKTYL